MNFFKEPKESNSNYWLNVLIMNNEEEKKNGDMIKEKNEHLQQEILETNMKMKTEK